MKQADIDRAVALATGETVSTIKRLGFLLADPIDSLDLDADLDLDDDPYVIDWDQVEADRSVRGPLHEPALA